MRNFDLGPKVQERLLELLPHDDPSVAYFREQLRPARALIKVTGWPEGEPLGHSDPGLTEEEQATLATLEGALEHASGRASVRIEEALTELRHKRDGTWDPEEYPQQAGLQCPYCEAIAWDGEEGGIRVVDVAIRWSSFGYRAEENDIHGSYDDNGDFDGDHYECEVCEHEVALPDDVTEDGW